jgi:hypothetical protein
MATAVQAPPGTATRTYDRPTCGHESLIGLRPFDRVDVADVLPEALWSHSPSRPGDGPNKA